LLISVRTLIYFRRIFRGVKMIKLNHLTKGHFFLNCDLIERIEELPDTVITMTNGKKLIVSESGEQVVDEIIKYRAKILSTYRKGTEIDAE